MKFLFVILALFTALLNNAQSFEFDLLTKYKTSGENYSIENLVYSNRNDPTYFLQVWQRDFKYEAKLLNMKNLEIHFYDVTTSNVGKELMFSFKYLRSEKVPYNKEYYSYNFEIDSLNSPTKISVTKGRRKKKMGMYLNINTEKSKYDLFPLFRVSCFHPFEIRKDLVLDGNYLIRSAEGKNFQGTKFKCELLNYEEIKLELNVPN